MKRRWGALAAALAAAAAGCGRGATASVDEALARLLHETQVHAVLSQVLCGPPPALSCADRIGTAWDAAREFYARRQGRVAWVDANGPTSDAVAGVAALGRAAAHGLDEADYGASVLAARLPALAGVRDAVDSSRETADALARFDARLTVALLALGHDVAVGRPLLPTREAPSPRRQPPDLAARLAGLLETGDLARWPEAVEPAHPQYARLRRLLSERSGALDPEAKRLIARALDRWRRVPSDLGDRYVLVNIPRFQLQVVEAGRLVLESRVVVGQPGDRTPVFSADMTAVVFSPYWRIPESIAAEETIPAILRDPAYLARNQIEIRRRDGASTRLVDPATVDWRDPASARTLLLWQRPGRINALGHVKFDLPNPFGIYLHDTPAHELFDRLPRAFSHGCVRVEAAFALVRFALADQPEWSEARIRAAMTAGEERRVELRRLLPVHVVYMTVWVDDDGTPRFFPDLYGLDR